jgi:hypothetical protein
LLVEVLTRIQQGTYRAAVAHVRQALTTRGEPAYKRAKATLLALMPGCTLRTRDRDVPLAEKVTSVTQIVHYDLDKLADHAHVKALLRTNPHVAFVFTSPRGNGLKIGIAATGITPANYKTAWRYILTDLKQRYPEGEFIEDNAIQYINALCFVSDDPELYMNPQAEPIAIPTTGPDDEDPPLEPPPASQAAFDVERITNALKAIPSDDYHEWIAVGQALHSTGHPLARGLWDWWSATSATYKAEAQAQKWRSFTTDGGRDLGEVYTIAHQHGWRPAGWATADPAPRGSGSTPSANGTGELRSLRASTNGQSAHTEKSEGYDLGSLRSLRSYHQWPTLRQEALYGVLGQFVTTIAPHSEADPVAILLQGLIYVGVVCGRSAWFGVEADRHTTNLFGCLVGFTSRGRKGTSYGHVERGMLQADSTWTLLNNVTSSCGSGEGIIAAVRDPVYRREPVKEKGRVVDYEMVETDPGVSDKRLLVYEAEFSSLLKVAERQGNTLSEILRQAWETGYLRNPVKTSPLKATGAHIAIAGHITIDDLQLRLTSTEAANGFGNRFLWALVKALQGVSAEDHGPRQGPGRPGHTLASRTRHRQDHRRDAPG